MIIDSFDTGNTILRFNYSNSNIKSNIIAIIRHNIVKSWQPLQTES